MWNELNRFHIEKHYFNNQDHSKHKNNHLYQYPNPDHRCLLISRHSSMKTCIRWLNLKITLTVSFQLLKVLGPQHRKRSIHLRQRLNCHSILEVEVTNDYIKQLINHLNVLFPDWNRILAHSHETSSTESSHCLLLLPLYRYHRCSKSISEFRYQVPNITHSKNDQSVKLKRSICQISTRNSSAWQIHPDSTEIFWYIYFYQ